MLISRLTCATMCRCCPCEPSAGDAASQPRQKKPLLASSFTTYLQQFVAVQRQCNITATCNAPCAPAQMLGSNTITTAAFGRARPLVPPLGLSEVRRAGDRGKETGFADDETRFVVDVDMCCGQGVGVVVAVPG